MEQNGSKILSSNNQVSHDHPRKCPPSYNVIPNHKDQGAQLTPVTAPRPAKTQHRTFGLEKSQARLPVPVGELMGLTVLDTSPLVFIGDTRRRCIRESVSSRLTSTLLILIGAALYPRVCMHHRRIRLYRRVIIFACTLPLSRHSWIFDNDLLIVYGIYFNGFVNKSYGVHYFFFEAIRAALKRWRLCFSSNLTSYDQSESSCTSKIYAY